MGRTTDSFARLSHYNCQLHVLRGLQTSKSDQEPLIDLIQSYVLGLVAVFINSISCSDIGLKSVDKINSF